MRVLPLPRRKERRRRKVRALFVSKLSAAGSSSGIYTGAAASVGSLMDTEQSSLELLRYWDLSGEESDTFVFFCEYTPPPSSLSYHHLHHGQPPPILPS